MGPDERRRRAENLFLGSGASGDFRVFRASISTDVSSCAPSQTLAFPAIPQATTDVAASMRCNAAAHICSNTSQPRLAFAEGRNIELIDGKTLQELLREPNNRASGEDTYGRGISDEGKIVGYFGALPVPQVTGFVTDVKELHRSKPPKDGFVALAIPARNQLQIPGAFGTLPQGISIEGVVSGAFIDGSGEAHGFIARPKDD